MTFVLFLHVAAAVFIIGPLTMATMVTPRLIRQGDEGLATLRWANRATRMYGIGSLLVFVLGVARVRAPYSFGQFWVSASMTLYVVAVALLFAVVERDQRAAIRRTESGDSSPVQAGRIAATSGAVAVMWLAIVALMIYKPGGPAGH